MLDVYRTRDKVHTSSVTTHRTSYLTVTIKDDVSAPHAKVRHTRENTLMINDKPTFLLCMPSNYIRKNRHCIDVSNKHSLQHSSSVSR